MHFTTIFHLACAAVALVLSILCVLAGHRPGFMENHHIITLNTSTLGHNILPGTDSSDSGSTVPSFGNLFGSHAYAKRDSIGGEISSQLDGVLGNVADSLSAKLGIKQWYSMHLMDMCEGTYTPNATALNAQQNISACTPPKAMYGFDISSQLNSELQVGPLHLDLADLGWPSAIQDGLTGLSTLLSALFILYMVGIITTSLNIMITLAVLVLHGCGLGMFGNQGLASLSFISLLAASSITTFVQFKAVDLINTHGNDIGVYAYRGDRYMILTWMAVISMFFAMVMQTISLLREKLERWNAWRMWATSPGRFNFKAR